MSTGGADLTGCPLTPLSRTFGPGMLESQLPGHPACWRERHNPTASAAPRTVACINAAAMSAGRHARRAPTPDRSSKADVRFKPMHFGLAHNSKHTLPAVGAQIKCQHVAAAQRARVCWHQQRRGGRSIRTAQCRCASKHKAT